MTEHVTAEIDEKRPRTVEITVNKKHIEMPGPRATGLQIKEAAIAQGVKIEPDFQLALVHGHERTIIGDTDEIELHKGEKFVATAADDNS